MGKLRNTKIVATIGPASSSKENLKKLIDAGLNVARLNFSHGTHEDHAKVIKSIRELNEEHGYQVAMLADLQGPKLRVGDIENGGVELVKGEEIIITSEEVVGTKERVYLSYDQFAQDVKPGERILMDDGKLILTVISSNGKNEVTAQVIHGGILKPRKGVNLPNTKISQPSLTEKDQRDLQFIIENDLDWVGLSFVRQANDIKVLKKIIHQNHRDIRVIAKVEKPEAIADLDNIIAATDAVMIARGDLGVEIPMEEVPLIQKSIIQKCLHLAKPVIVATQMMESMIENPSPSRAEVTDVANAVLEGADAVMLSGETSVGKHPALVVKAMVKIINEAETHDSIYNREQPPTNVSSERFIANSICYNAVRLNQRTNASAIVTMSFSGYTAFKVSSHRPATNIFVFTGNKKLMNTLSLVWGVKVFYYDKFVSTDDTITDIKQILKREGHVKANDLMINIASMPITDRGMANMLKLTKI